MAYTPYKEMTGRYLVDGQEFHDYAEAQKYAQEHHSVVYDKVKGKNIEPSWKKNPFGESGTGGGYRPYSPLFKEANFYKSHLIKENGNDSDAKIYVVSLSHYTEGRPVGKWIDLGRYSSGREVMQAIYAFIKSVGGEEYAIHDTENFPEALYHEYMGEEDFDKYYEFKNSGFPAEVMAQIEQEYGWNVSEAQEHFIGSYDSERDLVDNFIEEGLVSDEMLLAAANLTETDIGVTANDLTSDLPEEDQPAAYENVKDQLESDAVQYFIDTLGYSEEDIVAGLRKGISPFYLDMDRIAREIDYSGEVEQIKSGGKIYAFQTL